MVRKNQRRIEARESVEINGLKCMKVDTEDSL